MRRCRQGVDCRGCRGDQGATLVETSFVLALILIPLLLGILEFGLLFKDWLTVSNSSREAANVISSAADDPLADIAGLRSVENTMIASGIGSLQSVRISNADTGQSNTYTYNPITTCGWDPCPDPDDAGYIPPGWAPSDRNVEVGNLDRVTVTLVFTHDYVTGILGSSVDLTRSVTNRLEPQVYSS